MELSISQDVYNVNDIVQQYLHDAESSPSGLEERSHLAQLCSECILLFKVILNTLPSNGDSVSKEMKTISISLKRSYGRLKIWADENGAIDGTLDATLAASPDLRRDILKYIVSISHTLSESKSTYTSSALDISQQQLILRSELINFLDVNPGETILRAISAVKSLTTAVTEGDSESSSDSGFSDSSSYSVKDVLEDLKVDTTCLQDLEPLLCSPIIRTDPEPTALLDTTRMTWSPHQPYSDKVSARFPMAADDLVIKLGKANYERYLRCHKQKAANETRDTPPDQAILTFPASESSKFHDSGIGSSLLTATTAYAETVMSYGMGEGRRVRVPPLPAGAKEGLPFACLACGNWVKITTNSAWKQHLYKDLEPWVCLEADCVLANDTFPTRKDWTTHLALDHGMGPEWHIIACPLCRDEIGPGKHSITRHIGEHLEEISLSALPADCEFEDESDGGETDREDDNLESIDPAAHIQEREDVLNRTQVSGDQISETAAGFVDNPKQDIERGVLRDSETRRASAQPVEQQKVHLQPSQQGFTRKDSEENNKQYREIKPTPQQAEAWDSNGSELRTLMYNPYEGIRDYSATASPPSHGPTQIRGWTHTTGSRKSRDKKSTNSAADPSPARKRMLPVFHIDQQVTAHKPHTQESGARDAIRHRQAQNNSFNGPITASQSLKIDNVSARSLEHAGKGKEKQQAPAEAEDT